MSDETLLGEFTDVSGEDFEVCCYCHRPIIRCDSQPEHIGCSSGYGWIHVEPWWGHGCGRVSLRRYARPEPEAVSRAG